MGLHGLAAHPQALVHARQCGLHLVQNAGVGTGRNSHLSSGGVGQT